jgi:hypothetical protein
VLGNPPSDAIDRDGWLQHRRVARVELDGSTRIVDRLKELSEYQGYQVAPA